MALAHLTGNNEHIEGVFSTGKIPQEIMNSTELSDLGKVSYIFRRKNAFNHYLHTKMGKMSTVNARKFKEQVVEEYPRRYPVVAASGQTNFGDAANRHQIIGINNDLAKTIVVNDMFVIKDLYSAATYTPLVTGQVEEAAGGNQGLNVGQDLKVPIGANINDVRFSRGFNTDIPGGNGAKFVSYEQVKVLEVMAEDSGGNGVTLVRLDRCIEAAGNRQTYGGDSVPPNIKYGTTTGIGADPATAAIQVGDTLYKTLSSFAEGTGGPTGYNKSGYFEENYTQLFKAAEKYTWESRISIDAIDKKLKDMNPHTINQYLTQEEMIRQMEYAIIFGRRSSYMDNEGNPVYTTGGIIDGLTPDDDHIIKYNQNTLSWFNLYNVLGEAAALGGSQKRLAVYGHRFHSNLVGMFEDSGKIRINPEMTKKYNIQVYTLYAAGLELDLMPTDAMSEVGYDNKMLILDDESSSYELVTHPGWEYKREEINKDDGVNVKEFLTQGMIGLRRRNQEYQAMIDFSNINP